MADAPSVQKKNLKTIFERLLFKAWMDHPGLGVPGMVGLPRIRFLYSREGTCRYPMHQIPCSRGLDFEDDLDMFSQINDDIDFSSQTVKDLQCESLNEYENLHLTLKYTRESKLG